MPTFQIIALFGIAFFLLAFLFNAPSKLEEFFKKQKVKDEREKSIKEELNRKNSTVKVVESIFKILIEFKNLEVAKNSLGDDIFSKISETGFNEISIKFESLKTVQPEPAVSESEIEEGEESEIESEEFEPEPEEKLKVEEPSWMNDYNNYKFQ